MSFSKITNLRRQGHAVHFTQCRDRVIQADQAFGARNKIERAISERKPTGIGLLNSPSAFDILQSSAHCQVGGTQVDAVQLAASLQAIGQTSCIETVATWYIQHSCIPTEGNGLDNVSQLTFKRTP